MNFRFGSVVTDTVSRLMVPLMLVAAMYILVHGHHSPGGGFQAGTLLAAAMILVRLVQGNQAIWGVSRETALVLMCVGTLIYAGTGLFTTFLGRNVLDYSAIPLDLPTAELRAIGILSIEIGVALAVMGVFIAIFDSLVGRGEQE